MNSAYILVGMVWLMVLIFFSYLLLPEKKKRVKGQLDPIFQLKKKPTGDELEKRKNKIRIGHRGKKKIGTYEEIEAEIAHEEKIIDKMNAINKRMIEEDGTSPETEDDWLLRIEVCNIFINPSRPLKDKWMTEGTSYDDITIEAFKRIRDHAKSMIK
jgi:hypothetical protein